jgi:CrcB protein
MEFLKPVLFIGAGGFLGSIARYSLHLLISSRSLATFPWGTFTVNIIGCLLIGILVGLETRHELINEPLKWLLITGFCGGFTTFSTFSIEGLALLNEHQFGVFFGYAIGSVVIGILATFLGYGLIRWLI